MPIYENISNAHLFLPREDGLKPDIELLPSRVFNGSQAFYGTYVGSPHYLLRRNTEGYETTGSILTAPDRIFFNLEGSIDTNNMTASATDASVNSQVTAGTAYSAYGIVTWDTAIATDYTMFFSILGNGDHGGVNEATFALSAAAPAGPAVEPQIAGSRIDCLAGTITFSITGPGILNPRIEVVYEMSREGERTTAFINKLLDTPNLVSSYTYVSAAEAGSEYYVAGSAGQIKVEKVFSTGSKVGDRAKKIIYMYQDITYPTKATKKIEELDFVVAADLA